MMYHGKRFNIDSSTQRFWNKSQKGITVKLGLTKTYKRRPSARDDRFRSVPIFLVKDTSKSSVSKTTTCLL